MESATKDKTRIFQSAVIAFSLVLIVGSCDTGGKGLLRSETPGEFKNNISIPALDLDADSLRQVLVDREPGQIPLGYIRH